MGQSFTMRILLILPLLVVLISCKAQTEEELEIPIPDTSYTEDQVSSFYEANKGNKLESISKGTVGNGSLVNGKLFPFSGPNFQYFDTASYMEKRAYVNDRVLEAVLATYDSLYTKYPDRSFRVMECSNEHGGKIAPHRTHQNGLSIDFMTPLARNGVACPDYDDDGVMHYLMDFDDTGHYLEDKSVVIDFDLLGEHLIILNELASQHGLKIDKVIFKKELKDELYASEYGDLIRKKGIYITKNLTPMINALHDDHYHIDFGIIR